jgi:hypothetical protein
MVLWLAFFETDIVIPSEHADFMSTIDSLNGDYHIDYKKMISASSYTENARFMLWEKHDRRNPRAS